MSTPAERRDARVARRKLLRAGLVPAIIKPPRYLAVCDSCPDRSDCPVWLVLSPCNRAKALNGDPAYPCPSEKF